jgi:hypothetical protein
MKPSNPRRNKNLAIFYFSLAKQNKTGSKRKAQEKSIRNNEAPNLPSTRLK